ncbi:MAG: leucine-rich repeat domain-containing protein [Treponema sp.]|nr:leucine-rich repeat domain-containing protein [Treponema sp.]
MILRKKSLIFITAFFVSLFAWAEEPSTEPVSEEIRYQFIQPFKWKATENAKSYEINVESLDNGEWVKEASVKTKKTSIQLPLYPGQKRVSITSLNRLGRRGKSTEWAEFVVLGETQPYLYADYLKKSIQWESPVLRVTRSETENYTDDVLSESGDPEYSFFLKGKNIFLSETKFYMVPVEESSSGGRHFEAYNKLRKTVPLKIARRDFERPGVVVEYNPDELHSGYYQIIAENPGDQKTSLDILVMANREPVFNEDQFVYFPNYEVHILDAEKIKENDGVLKVQGSGFSGETLFSLSPSTAGIPYPFATSKERRKLELTVSEITPLSQSGDMELSFKVSAEDVPPGYYNLTAENSMGRTSQFLLVRDVEKESLNPEIDSIATSKGDKNTFNVELKGKNLSSENVYTLISQRSDFTGLSTRIPLSVLEEKKSGKKIVLNGDREKITEGVYGILAESPVNSVVKFISVNKKYKSKEVELTKQEEEDLFIRPANFVPSEDDGSEEVEELVYTVNQFKTKKQYRVLFPYIAVDLHVAHNYWAKESFAKETVMAAGFNFELLNLNFLHLGGSAELNWQEEICSQEVFMNFSTTHQDFRPYIGFGVGENVFKKKGNGLWDLAKSLYSGNLDGNYPVGIYAFANVGVTLGNFLDVKYTMHLSHAETLLGLDGSTPNEPETGKYLYDDITVSARVPLGKLKRIQKPKNQTLTITKKGPASGQDYKLRKDIKRIVFSNGVTEISGFNDNYMLTDISVPDTVRVIGRDAFKNCYNLKEVILPDGVVEIADGAFEGCRSMQKITLPSSIRKISPTAFSDWQDFQYVVYEWTKDDTTVRNLGGLEGKRNFTTVYDVKRTPFEDKSIFFASKGPGSKVDITSFRNRIDGVDYIQNTMDVTVTGTNMDSCYGGMGTGDAMVMKYLVNGDGVTFQYIGDGNNYEIVIMSKDGNTRFTYQFYAKKGLNELTVPFSHFIYDQYSSKRYVKIKKMDIGYFAFEIAYDGRYKGKKYKLQVYGIETIMEKKKK